MRTSAEGQLYRCSACGRTRPAGDFSFASAARGLLNSYCRACHAAYRHAHYLANKPEYIRRAIAQTKARRIENRREILRYLAEHPCVDCGIANVVVLEFDHREPLLKAGNVGTMKLTKRWERVRAEIEKCEVRCVNCHRRKTASTFSSRVKATP